MQISLSSSQFSLHQHPWMRRPLHSACYLRPSNPALHQVSCCRKNCEQTRVLRLLPSSLVGLLCHNTQQTRAEECPRASTCTYGSRSPHHQGAKPPEKTRTLSFHDLSRTSLATAASSPQQLAFRARQPGLNRTGANRPLCVAVAVSCQQATLCGGDRSSACFQCSYKRWHIDCGCKENSKTKYFHIWVV